MVPASQRSSICLTSNGFVLSERNISEGNRLDDSRTLVRRLEQLEAVVLPTDPPLEYMRIHSISSNGEVVNTRLIKLNQVRPAKVPRSSGGSYR